MKKSLIILTVLTTSLMACGQTPPKKVTDNFKQKFPDAIKIEWGQEEENEWEAEFNLNNQEMSASFDNNGKWLETESEVKKSDMAAEAVKAVALKFNGWKMNEAESNEQPDFKGYEMRLEKGDTEIEILVTTSGGITINNVKVEDEHNEKGNREEQGEKEEKEEND
jgi:Putative beta-lactamase-inhibitor-like, PepSY-like